MFKDFEDFKTNITWFIKPADVVNIKEGVLTVGDDFIDRFPNLYKLISAARVLDVTINNNIYKLLSWTRRDDISCGWLCKFEPADISALEILPEHQLLLDTMGGIQESYNQPGYMLTNNQNFLFIKSQCRPGLDGWMIYYIEMCQDEDITPMPETNMIAFVGEANGNLTVYDKITGQVYLFAHDHSFDYVTFLEGQPHYTYHLINGVNTFTDYAETVARQWMKWNKSTQNKFEINIKKAEAPRGWLARLFNK
jgi:hypothetical protein